MQYSGNVINILKAGAFDSKLTRFHFVVKPRFGESAVFTRRVCLEESCDTKNILD